MYVWQDVRKACPFDQSLLYSLGNAGGRGHPVGVGRMGIISIGEVFREGGCSYLMRSSNCWKLLKSDVSCFCVSISLASELTMACSTDTRWSLGVGAC